MTISEGSSGHVFRLEWVKCTASLATYLHPSRYLLTRHTITVSVKVVWIAWVLLQHLLCFFMGHEACAVQVAISPTPRTGLYNSGKCFIVILGCAPSVEGVGS